MEKVGDRFTLSRAFTFQQNTEEVLRCNETFRKMLTFFTYTF